MICLIALTVFSVAGIFSATHRVYAKEAFNCVFRRITLRKCNTSFDEKMKMKIVGKLISKSPKLAKSVHQHFEVLSWTFTFLLITSFIFSGLGLYNLAVYGSCEPHSTDCVFNSGELTCGSQHCETKSCDCETNSCVEPFFEACEGSCDCQETVCG